jgi:hypothetical protein
MGRGLIVSLILDFESVGVLEYLLWLQCIRWLVLGVEDNVVSSWRIPFFFCISYREGLGVGFSSFISSGG